MMGTGMATPVVSGAVALLLQANPSLSPDTVKVRLMKSAGKSFPLTSTATDPNTGQTFVDTYDIFTVGAGYIDVMAALRDTDVAAGYALSPSATYNPLISAAIINLPAGSTWNNGPLSLTAIWVKHFYSTTSG